MTTLHDAIRQLAFVTNRENPAGGANLCGEALLFQAWTTAASRGCRALGAGTATDLSRRQNSAPVGGRFSGRSCQHHLHGRGTDMMEANSATYP